jgi:hypothetical protein
MTSILFARQDSVYKAMGLDVWDIDRDARKWPGGNPSICHPPCRAWGQLSHMANPREDEKELAIFSVNMIRQFGGVLEHPRASKLWKEMKLPKGQQVDKWGGYTLCIDQHAFGHKARKRSLLYVVGVPRRELPPVPMRFEAVEYVVGSSSSTRRNQRKEIGGSS